MNLSVSQTAHCIWRGGQKPQTSWGSAVKDWPNGGHRPAQARHERGRLGGSRLGQRGPDPGRHGGRSPPKIKRVFSAVSIQFGRIGQGGNELRYTGTNKNALRAIIRERLHRRLSAPKRIGCSYRLTSLNAAPDFDASVWLRDYAIRAFFRRPNS